MLNNLQQRDNYLLEEVSKMISNTLNASQQDSIQRSQPQQRNSKYEDLDVDNIAGGDKLQNALRGVNPADYIPGFGDLSFSTPINNRRNESPTKSLEFLFKSGGIQKSILTSSNVSFRPWLKYIIQIFEGLWLSSITKINPYKMPKKETWLD